MLLPAETYTVSYTAVARKAGVYTNTAVSSRADDVNPSNNQASVNVEVTVSGWRSRSCSLGVVVLLYNNTDRVIHNQA